MKSVLISIQPKWCELIASGQKTVEVRKTKPKLETPFKCYIYCTKDNTFAEKTLRGFSDDGKAIYYKANKGKVIGEFVCDKMLVSFLNNNDGWFVEKGCLTPKEIDEYQGDKAILYGWYISDLKIYDNPKKLSEIAKPDKCPYNSPIGCTYGGHCYRAGQAKRCGDYVERPPKSWCYVEEVE